MIIRIKINRFKSLVDTEMYFSPFTCIAGANAIGKSNFFDALMFLSHLADNTILQAAKSIRSENQKNADIRDIFFKNGTQYLDEMRTTEFIAKKMPRTLLSTVTAESPTAFLVRQEMRNWLMLQFEPSVLRQPNSIFEVKNAEITANGLNLPATLYRLHNQKKDKDVYQSLTNQLKDLVEDVKEITIDKDEKRDLLTLNIQFKGGFSLPAQSLSDGTLRFLGLAIIEEDNASNGLICLEEPENGINPKKVHQMVELLKNMATDTSYEVGEDNPFRQVIINTHAPLVVRAVPDESLYLAKSKEIYLEKFSQKVKSTTFTAIKDTWKTIHHLAEPTELGEVMAYLGEDTVTIIEEKSVIVKPTKRTVAENISQYKIDFES